MEQNQARTARPAAPAWMDSDLLAVTALIAAALAYYFLPSTLLSLVALLVLAAFIWWRSDLAVLLVPLAVPLYMLPKQLHVHRTLSFSLGETVIVLCVVVVTLQQLLAARRDPVRSPWLRTLIPDSPFLAPAVAFLLAAVLATVAARFHTVAFRYFRELVLEPVLYYWLLTVRVRTLSAAARLALVASISGMIIAALGVGQLLFRPQDLAVAAFAPGQPHLVRAVYGNENNLALLLDRSLPLALSLALLPGWLAAVRRPRSSRATGVSRPGTGEQLAIWALLAGSALMAYIVYRTQSRGGEVALGCSVAVLFLYWQRRRPLLIAALALVGVLAALVERTHIYNLVVNGHGLTTDARISLWQSALRMLRDHPILGVGPDNFLYYYSNDSHCAAGHVVHYYYQQRNAQGVPVNFEPCLSHPHNLFLDLWLSTGVLGFAAGLTLFLLFAVLLVRAFRVADSGWRGPLLGVGTAMVATVVHGQVDNSYFLPDLAVYFWLCLGVVAAWYAEHPKRGVP
jgi:putative inorganic carbon (HCO3(-)) transporter